MHTLSLYFIQNSVEVVVKLKHGLRNVQIPQTTLKFSRTKSVLEKYLFFSQIPVTIYLYVSGRGGEFKEYDLFFGMAVVCMVIWGGGGRLRRICCS